MAETIGLLVMAYGTPRRREEIEAFYTHVRHGVPPTQTQLENLRQRYAAIGGLSPLAAITVAQATRLVEEMNHRDPKNRFKAYVGYKHAAPSIADAVGAMHADGVHHAVSLVLAPHYSTLSVQSYNDQATRAARSLGGPTLAAITSWYREPKFIALWAERIEHSCAQIPPSEQARTVVIFSAHSLPERILQIGDPYVQQVNESARLIAGAARLSHYVVGWQSAGRTADRWLGPDVRDLTRQLYQEPGYRNFVYCPVGFVADHLEVLYDNDVECRALTGELGARYLRPAMPNTDPMLIDCLCDAVSSQLRERVRLAS